MVWRFGLVHHGPRNAIARHLSGCSVFVPPSVYSDLTFCTCLVIFDAEAILLRLSIPKSLARTMTFSRHFNL